MTTLTSTPPRRGGGFWGGLTADAVGPAAEDENPGSARILFRAAGTFGGAGAVIEGSADGTTWDALGPPLSAPGAFSLEPPAQPPRYYRPRVLGGDSSTAIDIRARVE